MQVPVRASSSAIQMIIDLWQRSCSASAEIIIDSASEITMAARPTSRSRPAPVSPWSGHGLLAGDCEWFSDGRNRWLRYPPQHFEPPQRCTGRAPPQDTDGRRLEIAAPGADRACAARPPRIDRTRGKRTKATAVRLRSRRRSSDRTSARPPTGIPYSYDPLRFCDRVALGLGAAENCEGARAGPK